MCSERGPINFSAWDLFSSHHCQKRNKSDLVKGDFLRKGCFKDYLKDSFSNHVVKELYLLS